MLSFSPKQPYEEYYCGFDFADILPAGTTITTAVVSAVDPGGADVTATLIDGGKQYIDGATVYAFVKAGGHGTRYRLTCRIVCSDGVTKLEMDGLMAVAET